MNDVIRYEKESLDFHRKLFQIKTMEGQGHHGHAMVLSRYHSVILMSHESSAMIASSSLCND